jgi:hypothetical protein
VAVWTGKDKSASRICSPKRVLQRKALAEVDAYIGQVKESLNAAMAEKGHSMPDQDTIDLGKAILKSKRGRHFTGWVGGKVLKTFSRHGNQGVA